MKERDLFHNVGVHVEIILKCVCGCVCIYIYICVCVYRDRLCGLVVRVSGYRYRGPGFDPRRYQIF